MKINLIEYFERTVELYPDKLAVCDDNSFLSFKELEHKAKSIAIHISAKYDSINKPIAIYLPKNNDSIVSFIATLYSGNCYVPLETKNPINRIQSILQVLKPLCIITNNRFLANLKKCELGFDIINLDEIYFESKIETKFNYNKCIDTDPAYIIHTSGSTGIPKGVATSHKSIIDRIKWKIDTFAITKNEAIGNQFPFVFDGSTTDIYLMVFTGASLYLIPEKMFIFPANLLNFIVKHQINFIFWVPSVYINIANLKLLNSIKIPSVKKVLFGGEVMPTASLNYWIHCLNKDVLYANIYGPTETTILCTCYIVNRKFRDDEVLPIGKALRNTDILLLNEENKLCEIKEKGELCMRGSSIALGYWNDFEKTDSVFVQNPLNNSFPEKIYRTGDIVFINEKDEYIFVGRKDFQIKHLGYRIELGEIEHSVLSNFSSINACVLYDHSKGEIVLIYESGNNIQISEFRNKLIALLSKYMVPTRYIKIDKLPLTISGKIDRVNLNIKLCNNGF